MASSRVRTDQSSSLPIEHRQCVFARRSCRLADARRRYTSTATRLLPDRAAVVDAGGRTEEPPLTLIVRPAATAPGRGRRFGWRCPPRE